MKGCTLLVQPHSRAYGLQPRLAVLRVQHDIRLLGAHGGQRPVVASLLIEVMGGAGLCCLYLSRQLAALGRLEDGLGCAPAPSPAAPGDQACQTRQEITCGPASLAYCTLSVVSAGEDARA